MVLDRVGGPSWEASADLGPLVTVLGVHLYNHAVLVVGPCLLVDLGVKMVQVSFSALFADTPFEVTCDKAPSFGAVLLYKLDQLLVFFLCP